MANRSTQEVCTASRASGALADPYDITTRTQRHHIPSADQSKHAIRSGTARTVAHRRKTTGWVDRHFHGNEEEARSVKWDVTDTVADSKLHLTSAKADGAAENAATRKKDEYVDLQQTYTFVPLAFVALGPINVKGVKFPQELSCRLVVISDDNRLTSFLFQRISITLQWFNAITFADTFADSNNKSSSLTSISQKRYPLQQFAVEQ